MKKFILSLLFTIFGIISFSSAESITLTSLNDNGYTPNFVLLGKTISTKDFIFTDYSCSYNFCELEVYNGNGNGRCYFLYRNGSINKTCSDLDIFSSNSFKFTASNYNHFNSITISGIDLTPNCPECETCPEVDTGAILSGYIAIEDVTTNYCTSNDLCPEMSGGNSAIYINDIRHESMPFINIRIPEEIERNYEYTGNNTQLDISVEGYGYDQEKMQNMINTQYYTPTSEEMSSLIGKIADFLPLIAIALLIIRIRRVLKKVFRF